MRRIAIPFIIMLVASCAAQGNAVVTGAGPDDMLKLRAGPSLAFNVILGLPDGTELNRRECVTELGQRWCRVSLAKAPAVTGFVSADYLSMR